MFERFTEAARRVVVLAQDESRALGHDWIGTEHLLLGVLREEDGIGAVALAELGLTLVETQDAVASIVGSSDKEPIGQIPFTPRAKKVLERSLREAMALSHNYISTEHLLLALAHEPRGVAADIFRRNELDEQTVRETVMNLVAGPGRRSVRAEHLRKAGWEYRLLDLADGDALTVEVLNELGAERWELVSVVHVGEGLRAVFKRRA